MDVGQDLEGPSDKVSEIHLVIQDPFKEKEFTVKSMKLLGQTLVVWVI